MCPTADTLMQFLKTNKSLFQPVEERLFKILQERGNVPIHLPSKIATSYESGRRIDSCWEFFRFLSVF